MYSGLIGKVQKAKGYALERERVSFSSFAASFRGEHGNHQVIYDQGSWRCSCDFFGGNQTCSHTMALERMLECMISALIAPPG